MIHEIDHKHISKRTDGGTVGRDFINSRLPRDAPHPHADPTPLECNACLKALKTRVGNLGCDSPSNPRSNSGGGAAFSP